MYICAPVASQSNLLCWLVAVLHRSVAVGFRLRKTSCNVHGLIQGVVTYMSPVEAFATAVKFFDRQKVCLIA